MKYLKKINEMDTSEYKNQIGNLTKRKQSYHNRIDRCIEDKKIKKYNKEFKNQWSKDFKDNLDHYMDLFLKYGVKEENFTDIITDDKLLYDFFNPHTSGSGLVVLGDDKEDEETTIEICDIPDELYKSFMGMYYCGETYYFDTIKEFNDKLEDILREIFAELLQQGKANGACKLDDCLFNYVKVVDEYTDSIVINNCGVYSITLNEIIDDDFKYSVKEAKKINGITDKEFCDVINEWIKNYNNNLNNILNTIDSCKIYKSKVSNDDMDFAFITNAKGVSSCYYTHYIDNGVMYIEYIDDVEKHEGFAEDFDAYAGDPNNKEDYEITDEQEKIKIVKELIEFANDVKNEAIDE